jgi:predicted outer membrane repeat protein
MQNVSFKSNTARRYGGAVLLQSDSAAYIFGGIAVENTATEMGGSFMVYQSSTLFLSGFLAVDNQCGAMEG